MYLITRVEELNLGTKHNVSSGREEDLNSGAPDCKIQRHNHWERLPPHRVRVQKSHVDHAQL